tara:strand:+ start:446 stop:733 length:288 start_codon:yes stop_codon:yes gene_type:complete
LLVIELSSVLKIEFDFLQIDNLHASALKTLFQFSAGDKRCLTPLYLGAAHRENSTMPIWRGWLRDTKRIPKNLHAFEAFTNGEFNEIRRRNHASS